MMKNEIIAQIEALTLEINEALACEDYEEVVICEEAIAQLEEELLDFVED